MANWLTERDIAGSAFAPKDETAEAAIPLGALNTGYRKSNIPVTYHGRAHMFCVAPSGAGKSQALAIPALLTWPHSVVVLDVKGELYYHTAGYRQAGLGQTVYRFDPSDPDSNKFNPLSFINRGRFQIEQSIADIAEVIVPIPPNAREPFFLRAARQVAQTVLHYLCWQSPEDVPMRDFLKACFDPDLFLNIVNEIAEAGPEERAVLASTRNMARGLKGQFFDEHGKLNRTAQSVWAELSNQLAALNTEQIRAITEHTDWNPLDLRNGKTTVYVTLPPGAKGQYRAIMALVLNAHLGRLLERRQEKPPTLLLLDEMPQLGHMRAIEQVIDLGRGYGMLLYGFAQRRKQIEASYGDPGDFLGTFEARAYMNPSPEDGSAEMLSKALGDRPAPSMKGSDMTRVPVATINDLCGEAFRDDIIVLSRGASPARIHKRFAYADEALNGKLGLPAPSREKYAPVMAPKADGAEV